ncbi:MAG: hypothetical protein GEU86_04315 [Actinophytocola sp.]|nr:hypothetical protein [Actinophytocola sp.]
MLADTLHPGRPQGARPRRVAHPVLRVGQFAEAAGDVTPLIMDGSVTPPRGPGGVPGTDLASRFDSLVRGEIDAAFLGPPALDDRLELHTLFEEPRSVGVRRAAR